MKSITLVIPDAAAADLLELAQREFRRPRQEAAALLVDAIERAKRKPRRTRAIPAGDAR